jgi:nucleotide-binding universal stress UspA family protein
LTPKLLQFLHRKRCCNDRMKRWATMQRLLVAVNGSRHALDAVRHAAHLCLDLCASDLVLLNVQEPLEYGRSAAFYARSSLREIEQRNGEAALERARGILDDAGVDYVAEIKVGPVATTIAQAAVDHHCDSIVMGTAGRPRIVSLIKGSLANELVRTSCVPITLVR